MPAIPTTISLNKSTMNKDQFHTWMLDLHAYLTGVIASTGTAADARSQLGLGTASTKNTGVATGEVPLVGTVSATASVAGLSELSLLVDYTVPTNTTSVAFTGLDLQTHKGYRIEIDYLDGANATYAVSMFANGDTVATNYYSQFTHSDGTVVNSGRANAGSIFAVDANNRSKVGIDVYGLDTYLLAISLVARGVGAILKTTNYAWSKTATASNLTSLTFMADTTNGIASGTRFRIYRKDR